MKKKVLKIAILISFLIVFSLILYTVLKYETNNIDVNGYGYIKDYINDRNTVIANIFSFVGSTFFITLLCVLSLFFKEYRISIISNTLIVVGISETLKHLIGRTRPVGIALIEKTSFSFPSGHSIVSCAFYGLIIYFICKSSLGKKLKICLSLLFSMLIILIGLSRIYLGVHYTTDVLGGFSLAIIHLILYIELIYKKIFVKNKYYAIMKK